MVPYLRELTFFHSKLVFRKCVPNGRSVRVDALLLSCPSVHATALTPPPVPMPSQNFSHLFLSSFFSQTTAIFEVRWTMKTKESYFRHSFSLPFFSYTHFPARMTAANEPTQIIRLSPQSTPLVSADRDTYSSANGNYPSYSATTRGNLSFTCKVKARYQDSTKQYFVLWSDVKTIIKNADYAMDAEDGTLIPFMVNEAYEEIAPPRILWHPDRVLDVVTSCAPALNDTRNNGWLQSTVWTTLEIPFRYFLLLTFITLGMVLITKLFSLL